MAFQTGSRVRPELADADLSGFARSGEYYGQALANIGAQIGGAIKEYSKKKEKKKLTKQGAELLAGLPGAEGIGITDVETAMVAIDSMGGIDNALRALNAYQSGQASTAATRQATAQSASLFPTQKELQEQNLLRQKQMYAQGAEAFPLSQDISRAQLESMTEGERRATELFPFQLESAEANVAATKQGTAASQAGVSMAERKQVLSEKLAKQTQEQNERDYNLKVEELRFRIRTAAQRDPVSAKKLEAAQTYLDKNDLIMVDGAVYSKGGWFSGKATEVMNPAVLNIEGMEDLRRISMDMQSVPSNAASGNFEGYSIQSEGAGGQPVASDSAVSAAALDSVVQPRPEGSRIGRGMEQGATAIVNAAENVYDAGMDFGRGAKSLPFAAYDYLFNPSSPSFDESRARARGVTAPFFQ